VANSGDSRCIVGRKGQADQITLDHRPDVKSERERYVDALDDVDALDEDSLFP
jgi:protein phosphatase 1G